MQTIIAMIPCSPTVHVVHAAHHPRIAEASAGTKGSGAVLSTDSCSIVSPIAGLFSVAYHGALGAAVLTGPAAYQVIKSLGDL